MTEEISNIKQEEVEQETDNIQAVTEKIESTKQEMVAEKNKLVSDVVIIEIVHAFKDIIIEFIHRKY